MIDWDDAFDNTGYVAGAQDLAKGWALSAQALRDRLTSSGKAELDLAYGAGERTTYDLFHPEGAAKGTVLFVHGGYWRLFDKSYWSHLAGGPLAQGWRVAVISYPLAPDALISEITQSVQQAVCAVAERCPGDLRLTGHSAGGHLVARMCCQGVLPDDVASRIKRVVPISGVLDLVPLQKTKMNLDLKLSAEEAGAESPALLDPVSGVPVTFWVGAQERPEFLRQNRLGAERWERKGADVSSVYDTGHHHFSVIDGLGLKDSALTQEILR